MEFKFDPNRFEPVVDPNVLVVPNKLAVEVVEPKPVALKEGADDEKLKNGLLFPRPVFVEVLVLFVPNKDGWEVAPNILEVFPVLPNKVLVAG